MSSEWYGHAARVGRAVGQGTRLELLELLAQAEQSVEEMARTTGVGLTSVSAHLQVLKGAGLVLARREGSRIFYRLAAPEVAGLYVALNRVAARLLPVSGIDAAPHHGAAVPVVTDLAEARTAFMLDVRPRREFEAGHIPGAVSIPLAELEQRVAEVPTDRRVVIYCRGEFCRLARDAARMLRTRGVDASAMDEGVLEWRGGGVVDLSDTA